MHSDTLIGNYFILKRVKRMLIDLVANLNLVYLICWLNILLLMNSMVWRIEVNMCFIFIN